MKKLLALTILSLAAGPAMAAKYSVDSKASKVAFSIHKFKIGSDVPGTFDSFTGTFETDDKTKLLKSAKGDIKTASINTGEAKRDAHLKSDDFFGAEKNPEITFNLTEHTGTPAKGKVKGTLTMRGETKPVELDAVVKENGGVYNVDMTGTLNRKDWGIVWNSVLDKGGVVLADDVKISLNIKSAK